MHEGNLWEDPAGATDDECFSAYLYQILRNSEANLCKENLHNKKDLIVI